MQGDTNGLAAIGRRETLALLGALAFVAPRTGQARDTFDRAAFLDASGLVTGIKPSELTGLSDALFAIFQAQGAAVAQLAALARATPPANLAAAIVGTPMEATAKALAAAWYTATVGTRLLSYEDALAWKVAGFDATPGLCAGEFGFWAEPPAPL
jgi:hypothetical protein